MAILCVISLLSVSASVRGHAAPKEDAVMLFRYAEHLAQGQGITWNVGEHPVEGATDFLYMVTVAGISKFLGIGVILAARLLIAGCWVMLLSVIYLSTRLTLGANRWLSVALSLYLAARPGAKFVESGFGVPVATLAAAISWWLANELMYCEFTWTKAMAFGLSAVALGMIRPEGSLLGIFMLTGVVFHRPAIATQTVLGFLVFFGSVGSAYFLWRYRYFGHLLPNPFYLKGGGHLRMDGLKRSIGNVSRMLWPIAPLAALALRKRESRTNLAALLIPLVLFTAVWVLLSNENNHLMRFQFPLVALALISAPSLVWGLFQDMGRPRIEAVSFYSACALYVAIAMALFTQQFQAATDQASGVEYPKALRRLAGKHYTMVVTEAGQFPFYSTWRAIDALGLNDAYIAHHGISEQYLDQNQPELLMYHLDGKHSAAQFRAGLLETGSPISGDKQDRAVRIMHQYALHHGYILAAAYGSWVCNLHVFWVRPGSPDTDAIVSYIRNTPYYFLDGGLLSTDYRDLLPTAPCTMER